MRTLHWHPLSGHAHRAQLMLSLLGLDVDLVEVDLAAGAHKSPAFLELNPFGQLPVLVDEDGSCVADSNAILVYLAERYDETRRWYPEDAAARASIQRWLSVAAHEIARGPAAARLVNVFSAPIDHDDAKRRSVALLEVIEQRLARTRWLAGTEGPSIADVAGYSYIAHAPEGDVSLEPYAHVRAWLARIEAHDGFVPMRASAVGHAL